VIAGTGGPLVDVPVADLRRAWQNGFRTIVT
jgi:hypothetical protein